MKNYSKLNCKWKLVYLNDEVNFEPRKAKQSRKQKLSSSLFELNSKVGASSDVTKPVVDIFIEIGAGRIYTYKYSLVDFSLCHFRCQLFITKYQKTFHITRIYSMMLRDIFHFNLVFKDFLWSSYQN